MNDNMFSKSSFSFTPGANESAEYVQDLIPLVDIACGMYIIKDKGKDRYVKVKQLTATNFSLKNDQEQNNIIATFHDWLKTTPIKKCQMKIITRPEKEIAFVETLKERETACKDPAKKRLMRSNIDFIERQSQFDAADTEYYIIIEYEPDKKEKSEDIEKIAGRLEGIFTQAKEFFSSMGNSFIEHSDEDFFLGEFLYKLLNPSSSTDISFKLRARRILTDVLKVEEEKGIKRGYTDTEYVNLIAPAGMSVKEKDCLIYDKTYATYFYITSSGYPLRVTSAWPAQVFCGMPGVDIDIFFRKRNKDDFLRALRFSRRLTRLKANSRDDDAADREEIDVAYQSQQYMIDALKNPSGPEDAYDIVCMISVQAESYRELKESCEFVKMTARTNSLEINEMKRYRWEGFKASLPFNYIPQKIFKKARRNVTTDGLASMYPFTAYKLCDPKGIFLGTNIVNRTLCTFDPTNTSKYSNANMLVLGGSGSGKTFTMALFAERNVLLDNQVFIISSKKTHEFQRLCTELGGKFIRFGMANNQYINRFDIYPQSSVRKELYEETAEESWLSEKLKSLSTWYELLFRGLSEEELNVLDRATKDAYKKRGITEDNDSIFEGNDPASLRLKKMPVIEDVINALVDIKNNDEEGEVPTRLFTLLYNFINGTYSGFNRHTNVDTDKDFLVFDISAVPERIEPATVQAALDFIWSKVKEDPTKLKTIVIEEGWQYISKGATEAAAKQIQEIFKVVRGYGGSVILATQEIEDMLASEYGRSLISLSSIKILLGVEMGQSQRLQEVFRLQQDKADMLESFRKGACLMLAGKDLVTLQIQASDYEHALITTDRAELEELRKRREG